MATEPSAARSGLWSTGSGGVWGNTKSEFDDGVLASRATAALLQCCHATQHSGYTREPAVVGGRWCAVGSSRARIQIQIHACYGWSRAG